ncbi:uncharacterized protein LOC141499893 [Macrotis lagotis]|uniref:uncharacterized protein LOC141499893 n=1 Tax=Macrotis lagotis TaxID=92651 RepID=UPI003D6872B6
MIWGLFLLLFGKALTQFSCPQNCLCSLLLTDCHSANLSDIPQGIAQETESLFLNENHLTQLPPGILKSFVNLTFLGLSYNKLSLLNDTFNDIGKSILALDLSGNNLTELPPALFQETKLLLWLNLAQNRLSVLNGKIFASLEQLTYLDLSQNRLQLSVNMFMGLSRLDTLMMSGNHLHTVPVGVFDPSPNLKILDISNNEISSLPENLFENLTSLNDLLLDNNSFNKIPFSAFTILPNLEHFSISGNRIQTIPPLSFIGNSSLRKLDLSNNLVSDFPLNFFSVLKLLEFLNISGNNISTLPEDIFVNNTQLAFLYMDKNQFQTLPIFSGLQRVTELTLCCNGIENLPRTFTDKMYELELLDLSNNNITEIKGLDSNITRIILTGNPVCKNSVVFQKHC